MSRGGANSTEAVLGRHLQALMARDLDSLMKDYASNAVMLTPNGPAEGIEGIRAVFEGLLGIVTPEASANFKLTRQDIHGEYAYILWSIAPLIPFGGDTFHIHNGKIVAQSFIGEIGS
jgi:ketosteroid isomerase-like protein